MTIKENFDDVKTKELELHNSKVTSINSNTQRQIASINEQSAQRVKEEEVKLAQKKVQWSEMDQRIEAQSLEKAIQAAQLHLAELNQAIATAETKLQELEQPK